MLLKSEIYNTLEFNEKFTFAFDVIEKTRKHVLITGKAGTGKSTLLKYFKDNTNKNTAVLAPTGVAAVNVGGQTIHSFFYFRPDITPATVFDIKLRKKQREIFKNLDVIVIDEISMVRADLLDCVDNFLRMYGPNPDLPFGGVQMVFFGDLFQLSPVVTVHDRRIFEDVYESPYFFDSKIFRGFLSQIDGSAGMVYVELEKIYRQQEEAFIRLLGHVRDGSFSPEDLNWLNARVDAHFEPDKDDFFIYLTTTNEMADQINRKHLSMIKEPGIVFDAQVSGKFEAKNAPTQTSLELKKGAQVMLLNNDPEGRWVNGSVGKIKGFFPDRETVCVELDNGRIAEIAPFTWEIFRFVYNEENRSLDSESIGAFRQYPMRLAWAVTIHKSQGKTFSKVIIDTGKGAFAFGQIYVALSRCVRYDGIVLRRPIRARDIQFDERVVQFFKTIQSIQH